MNEKQHVEKLGGQKSQNETIDMVMILARMVMMVMMAYVMLGPSE